MYQLSQLPPEFTLALGVGFIVALILAIIGLLTARNAKKKLYKRAIDFQSTAAQLASAEDQIDELEARIHDTIEVARKERVLLQDKINETDISRVRAEEKVTAMQTRMEDWEEQKQQSIQAAKSAVLSAGSELSNKLLADHKREAAETKKQQTEQVKQTSERLMEQFNRITESVAAIRQTSGENKNQMDTVMRALTNPTGAGKMAEVGLENLLKNFGLIPEQDFIMQYHVDAVNTGTDYGNLKPDAVVFLPQDMIIAIDCKASKHLIELEEHANDEPEEELLARLKKTMDQHLRTLAGKDYKSAVTKQLKESGHSSTVGHSFNVMYVPSEMAVERIRQADPDIENKLIRSNVHMTGPSGLFAIFQLAKEQIATAQRDANNDQILDTLSSMMEGVAVAFGHVDKVGNSLKSSMEHFEKFARSANRGMLPKLRRLQELGVEPNKNKPLPSPLAQYDIRRIDDTVTIEADDISDRPKLEEVK